MKTTYLVYKDASAAKKELIIATKKEWDSIGRGSQTIQSQLGYVRALGFQRRTY